MLGPALVAQNVLFKDRTEDAYAVPKKGRNRALFNHFYVAYRMAPENVSHADMHHWNGVFSVGRRQKYAFARNFSMGWDLEYVHYKFSHRTMVTRPHGAMFDVYRATYVSHGVQLALFNRILFGKVGNNIGKYMDLGVYGAWNFNRKATLRSLEACKKRHKLLIRRPAFDDTFFYGVQAKLGIHRVVLVADYRFKTPDLSSLFAEVKIPKLTIGLEFSLYRPNL
ncbi:MAG: hypothetical protein CSA95_00045 [Bacteroidetes bacterium]|nr:MAG: hypothetical protein CSA95_00045 [Bacteroidota bacterium]